MSNHYATKASWQGKRGTTTERGYGHAWRIIRDQAMSRDDWLCQPCKKKGIITAATQCDHIKPKSEGGTDSLSNLQAICKDCHSIKTTQEAAKAQGRRLKPTIGIDGWPIE